MTTIGQKAKLIVITGAPGSGKTTLLNALQGLGYSYIPEPARQVIAEAKSGKVKVKNDQHFRDLILARAVSDFKSCIDNSKLSPIFFDRGIPDTVAYSKFYGLETSSEMAAGQTYRYWQQVLLTEPWEDIYCTDEARTMNYDETIPFHADLVKAYTSLEYDIVKVPQTSVAKRAEFIQTWLEENFR